MLDSAGAISYVRLNDLKVCWYLLESIYGFRIVRLVSIRNLADHI